MGNKTLFPFPKTPKFRILGNKTALSFPKTTKIGKMGNKMAFSFPKTTKIVIRYEHDCVWLSTFGLDQKIPRMGDF